MATKALTAVAQGASRNLVSAKKASVQGTDWRKLFIAQDAEAIWHEIASLVDTVSTGAHPASDAITQEVFIFVVATGRFKTYLEQGYSNRAISRELKRLIPS
jgi:hypothetical protein